MPWYLFPVAAVAITVAGWFLYHFLYGVSLAARGKPLPPDPYAHLAVSSKPRWDDCPGKPDRVIGKLPALGAPYSGHVPKYFPGHTATGSINGYRDDYKRPRSDTVGHAPTAEERMLRFNSPNFPTLAEAARRRRARNMRVLGRILTVVSLIGLVALLVSVMTD